MVDKLFGFVLPFLEQIVLLLTDVFDHLLALGFELVHLILELESFFLCITIFSTN